MQLPQKRLLHPALCSSIYELRACWSSTQLCAGVPAVVNPLNQRAVQLITTLVACSWHLQARGCLHAHDSRAPACLLRLVWMTDCAAVLLVVCTMVSAAAFAMPLHGAQHSYVPVRLLWLVLGGSMPCNWECKAQDSAWNTWARLRTLLGTLVQGSGHCLEHLDMLFAMHCCLLIMHWCSIAVTAAAALSLTKHVCMLHPKHSQEPLCLLLFTMHAGIWCHWVMHARFRIPTSRSSFFGGYFEWLALEPSSCVVPTRTQSRATVPVVLPTGCQIKLAGRGVQCGRGLTHT